MRKARKRAPREASLGKRLGPTGKMLVSGAVLGAGIGLGAGQPAEAATFQVTNNNDSGPGSLRQAILDANAAAGTDVITFQAGLASPILLTSGQLSVTDSVDVQGPDDALLTVSGNDSSRVFYLYSSPLRPDGTPSTLDVTISGLTIADGREAGGSGIGAKNVNLILDGVTLADNDATSTLDGGGLYFNGGGDLTIRDSIISGNTTAVSSGGGIFVSNAGAVAIERSTISGNQATIAGGGIHIADPDGGTLTIRETTISANDAPHGGGLLVSAPVEFVILENTTISGNDATAGNGGGIELDSFYSGLIRHTTIAGNTATGSGGGLFIRNNSCGLDNSIVADNAAVVDSDLANTGGAFNLSFTLVEVPGTATINDNGGNIFNQDPQLGPLTSNGGPTETHKPAAASPVVDAGDPSFAPPPATDQRGFARISGSGLDMGSVELGAGTLQFSLAGYSVNEEGGAATITVNRVGGGDGAVSVSFATSDGTAMQGNDYAPAAGMLSWADGDTAPKTFQVTILDDALFEGDETVNLALSNPQGAALGSPSTAVLTIADGEEPPAPPSEIPALGGLGKLLLAGLFGLGGSLLLRRRRSPDRSSA